MKHPTPVLCATVQAIALLAAAPAMAQTDQPVSKENPDARRAAEYWTADRFKAAKPLPLPTPKAGEVKQESAPPQPASKPESSDAQAPSIKSAPREQRLYDAQRKGLLDGEVEPQANGTFNAPYTSTRVFPIFTGSSAGFSADRAYPYRTIGKLFFSINGSPYVCSASVIQRRVVSTAGHCVHSGDASGFHDNFVFVPSFRDGVAPFKSWNWRYVITTGTWASGGGGVPNAADYAMIEFADQAMTTGGPLTKLGNVTGWLGWETGRLNANHTSKLGYPCNLDSCQKMQNVTSHSYRPTSPNNVEYGSDARGGSSGGPWVQNFAVLASGGGSGSNTAQNRVVGVTSYGYISADPKVQGASVPDSRWVQIWNQICARPGNCN
ncbi:MULTISPECIES: trypsin-like serine peptidase [Massilia]|nr:hypothetical protein [Massilia agrisoli]